MSKYNKGLGGLLDPLGKTPEEARKEELNKFYKDNIEGKTYTPRPPEISMTDFPTIDLTTLEIPENSFGHTSAQKEKMIKDHLERPGVTDGDIQDNDFWNAYKSNNSKDMLAYVKKYGDVGEVKQNKTIKKNPSSKLDNWKYTDPLSEMVGVEKKIATMGDPKSNGKWAEFVKNNKKEQHPAEAFHEEQINDIQKRGKSWLVKHLNKQDQETEEQKLAEDIKRESGRKAKVKVDQYGNPESATDRIQEQDRNNRKNREGVTREQINKRKI